MSKPRLTPLFKSLPILASLVLTLSVVTAISTGAAGIKPTVGSISVSAARVSRLGGTVEVHATVKNASICTFFVTPTAARDTRRVSCESGLVRDRVTLPANTSTKARVYTIHLVVTGRGGIVKAPLKRVTVVAAPKPIIKRLTTSIAGLPNAGGAISLVAQVADATSCHITVSPAITGFSGDVPCSSGSITVPVVLPANTTSTQISYIFTLIVNGEVSATSKALTVIVYPTTTVPSTTTTTTTTLPPTVGNTIPVPSKPRGLAYDGTHIWVASCSGYVTEIDANTKQVIRVIPSDSYNQFHCPFALAYDGTHIWVANAATSGNNSITELSASTGDWIRTISGSQIVIPTYLAVNGSSLWVINSGNYPSLSEYNTSTGALVKTITNNSLISTNFSFNSLTSLAFYGSNIWVTDNGFGGAVELNPSTGKIIRETSATNLGPSFPNCVVYSSGVIWVCGTGDLSADEYSASTGVYIKNLKVIADPSYIVTQGNYMFVVSEQPDTIVEYTLNGIAVKTIYKSSKNWGITGVLSDGTHLWVSNKKGSVTKLIQ